MSSEVESSPTPAVKNLRSRFEQLSQKQANVVTRSSLGPSNGTVSPRPRTTSNTHPSSPTIELEEAERQIRHTASSSSLNSKPRRAPPPPPPPRGSNIKSPPPPSSPLMRPVPVPPPKKYGEHLEDEVAVNVKDLRSKFSSKPPIPLRPLSSQFVHAPLASPVPLSLSPEDYRRANSSSSSDPLSESESSSDMEESNTATTTPMSLSLNGSIPPALPSRKSIPNSGSSRTSSEGEPSVVIPPRIPSRSLLPASTSHTSLSPRSASPSIPALDAPRLPVRRNNIAASFSLVDDDHSPPPLPDRPPTSVSTSALLALDSNGLERKPLGSGKLPPPPTRTIALGDKLPPARRPETTAGGDSDDSDAGDDESQKVDAYPDTSRASRRPPVLAGLESAAYGAGVHVHPHNGHAVFSGTRVVVANGHSFKVFDLSVSDTSPAINLDLKSIMSLKHGPNVHSMKLCTARNVWLGTKEGHIIEMDIYTGAILNCKLSAARVPFNHILRLKSSMICIDESGKILIYCPPTSGGEINLANDTPHVIRVSAQIDFAAIVGGKLWTAHRADLNSPFTPARSPIIRVYEVLGRGIGKAKSVFSAEPAGPITCAAVIPEQPDRAYVGHEGGAISIWALEADGPRCLEVAKVSASDIMSMAGVHGKLWVGGRNGMISTFIVMPSGGGGGISPVSAPPATPLQSEYGGKCKWLVTNCFRAHKNLPVLKIVVDIFAIVDGAAKVAVFTVGRDERARVWDGLCSDDWIDKAISVHSPAFSTYRNIKVLIMTWNADSARPETLNTPGDALHPTINPANLSFLQDVIKSVDSPDIISFGFQEVIDLESRKMAAKSVFIGGSKGGLNLGFGSKKKKDREDGEEEDSLAGLSDKVTRAYKRWYNALVTAVHVATMSLPWEDQYSVLGTESLVGLFTCVFVKNKESLKSPGVGVGHANGTGVGDGIQEKLLRDSALRNVKRGMGGRYGNKGGILARLVVDDTAICFINCHLAAGQSHVRARNADIAGILEDEALPVATEPLAYVGGGNGTIVLDHEIVFLNGDMNYRIDQRRDAIISAIGAGQLTTLHTHDQLLKEMKHNRTSRLRGFEEGPLSFAPTYKYDRRSNNFDSSEKKRSPAWCDRVLWRAGHIDAGHGLPSIPRVEQIPGSYRRYEVDVSDHRPVTAGFNAVVKKVQRDVRGQYKQQVQAEWKLERDAIMKELRQFYTTHGLA